MNAFFPAKPICSIDFYRSFFLEHCFHIILPFCLLYRSDMLLFSVSLSICPQIQTIAKAMRLFLCLLRMQYKLSKREITRESGAAESGKAKHRPND